MSRNTVWLLSTHLNFRIFRKIKIRAHLAKCKIDAGWRTRRKKQHEVLDGERGNGSDGSDVCSKIWLPNAACSMFPNVIEIPQEMY
ncbi:unnamed protein product [Acanthoscelides obtectus]|uniref:Uncharacterized protein n=1 Tax=Acanthoscelides obtectus TaxID=200917 RepID=A0A9P0JUS7_ACAOB|nr:unnamed protein product [Acanthoscelides obtectus]CAK1640675.1 hypothetical protein AOBTE_LOCUS11866 [Acanthoscelides obtectus]